MVAKKKVEDVSVDVAANDAAVENVVVAEDSADDVCHIPLDGEHKSSLQEEVNHLYEKGTQVQMKGLEMAEKLLDDFGTQKPPYNEQQLKIAMTAMDLYNAFKA